MSSQSRINVLIVDDSRLFREVIARGLSTDPLIDVIKAQDAYEARDKILEFEPDVMICDVEMPKMNGIEFIERLLPQYPLPVIVISSVSEAVFNAMKAGAVDFVSKPSVDSVNSVEDFIYQLIDKVKVAAVANVANTLKANKEQSYGRQSIIPSDMIIAIGASTGGTEALCNLLKSMPSNSPGIVIVQHIPPIFSRMFAERLNIQTKLNCKEAENGDFLEQGKVIIAPGDKHMRIKKLGDRYKIEVFEGAKINGHCPSVDVLFESVAREAKNKAIGIILTGMGYDGAKGLLSMRRAGARTIGQDEKSSVVYGMPKAAYEIGAVEKQESLQDIPKRIFSVLTPSR